MAKLLIDDDDDEDAVRAFVTRAYNLDALVRRVIAKPFTLQEISAPVDAELRT